MMSDHLLRKYAPIPATGWQQIDDEANDRPHRRAPSSTQWSPGNGGSLR
jgi:hypothetical protein